MTSIDETPNYSELTNRREQKCLHFMDIAKEKSYREQNWLWFLSEMSCS
jgi:hypothetical protein